MQVGRFVLLLATLPTMSHSGMGIGNEGEHSNPAMALSVLEDG
jgi:hypothetical protein